MKKFKLVLLILISIGLTACANTSNNNELQSRAGNNILKMFGGEDLERMQEFVKRFDDKIGDYVLAASRY